MSAPGERRIDPAAVTVGALMALEPRAASTMRDVPSLAERPGTTATPKRGQGHEIREIRPFAQGDDPRHLDAAATARTGSLQVRSFHEDRERTLMLIADFRRPMLWGTRGCLRSVAAAEALVMAGWRAALTGGAVGVVALSDTGPEVQSPRPRHHGMAQVAGCIARAHDRALSHHGAARVLAPDLLRAARQIPRGAGILLATGLDIPGDELDAALAALRAKGPLRVLLVEDAFETSPPKGVLPYVGAEGPTYGRFADLAEMRDSRADRLHRPGQQVQRLSTSGSAG